MASSNESHSPGRSPRHCAYCLIPIMGSEVKLCGKCGRRAYCSRQCQTLDWSHKRSMDEARKGQRGQGHKEWCGLSCGEEDLDWVVTPVEGKGLGLVALKSILARSRILVDAAQFSPYAHPATKELSSGGVDKKGAKVMGGQTDPDLWTKWEVNKLGCGDGEDSVLCLRLSRVNHACDPNAGHVYCNVLKVKILFAERDIAPGEEVCISYQPFQGLSDLPSTCSARKSICGTVLKSKWGISCPPDCHCNDPRILKDLQKAVDLDGEVLQLARSGRVDEAMKKVKELVTLQVGRLGSSYLCKARRTLHDGFQVGIMTKKTMSQGMDYANKMLEVMGDILHPKSALILEWEGYKRNPASHLNYLFHDRW